MPAKKTPKKAPKRRLDLDRPYSDGQYTTAKFRGLIMSALRRARWGPKCEVIKRAYTQDGINPKTGHKCKLHRCEECLGEFSKGDVRADHIEPVIPVSHNWQEGPNFLGYNWNEVMRRLFVEQDGFAVVCEECHAKKTNIERAERAANKQQS